MYNMMLINRVSRQSACVNLSLHVSVTINIKLTFIQSPSSLVIDVVWHPMVLAVMWILAVSFNC